jgi:hypothetical protein
LVAQSQVFEEQVPPGFQPGYGKTENNCQPTSHVGEDSGKLLGNPVFLSSMKFFPTTGVWIALGGLGP